MHSAASQQFSQAQPVYTEEWNWTAQRGSNPYPIPLAVPVTATTVTVTATTTTSTTASAVSEPALKNADPRSSNPSGAVLNPQPDSQSSEIIPITTPVTPSTSTSSATSSNQQRQSSLNDIDEGPYDAFFLTDPAQRTAPLPLPLALAQSAIAIVTAIATANATATATATATDAAQRGDGLSAAFPPNSDLLQAMIKLGIPFLDYALLSQPPSALVDEKAHVQRTVGGAALLGRRLLECMYALLNVSVLSEGTLDPPSGMSLPLSLSPESKAAASQPFLQFNEITEAERTLFLLEILISSRAKPLTADEVIRLKSLPLFTVRAKDQHSNPRPIAIADCVEGIFWCDNGAVLDGIVYPSATGGMSFLHFLCI